MDKILFRYFKHLIFLLLEILIGHCLFANANPAFQIGDQYSLDQQSFFYSHTDTLLLDRIISEHIDNQLFEGTVMIAEKGKVVYQRSAGFADMEKGRIINNESKFGIASITKMLTAIVILQLIEEKQLSVQDNLGRLLPDLNIPRAEKITVHHLLLHISGLPNEPDAMYRSPKTPASFVKESLEHRKASKPGRFNYANIDYVLLGMIIETLTGQRWREAVTERIIQPLGLKQTGFLEKGNYPENFAYSYQVSKSGKKQRDPDFFIENFHAAGCMYATAKDLLLIDQALYGEELLDAQSKEKMFTAYPEYNYTGYSVWTYRYPFVDSKPLIMERRGKIMGANVVLVRMLDSQQTIIILSNNDRFNPDSFGDSHNLREALIVALSK